MTPAPDGTVPLSELVATAGASLAGISPNASAEARWIVEEVAGLTAGASPSEWTRPATRREVARVDELVARRRGAEPLQYVLGRWSFRTLDLAVDARALIPRPETEAVVDVALGLLDARVAGAAGAPAVAFDMGSGTGAIALSIAVERPGTRVWAIERSPGAAQLTRENCAGIGRHGARVTVVQSDWFDAVPAELAGRVDLVVANPPYVADPAELAADVAEWEPAEALLAGEEGTSDLRRLVAESPRWLAPGGALCLELDPRQVPAIRAALADAGLESIAVHRDLAGADRCVTARRAEPNS